MSVCVGKLDIIKISMVSFITIKSVSIYHVYQCFRILSQVKVVLVHPEPPSLLGGFEGAMSMDASSNLRLDLTLFNVTGTVLGRLPAGNGSQFTFQVRLYRDAPK